MKLNETEWNWINYTYSWQRGSSKQSVLMHPRSGGGEVWSGPVVQVGKQGSDEK